MQHTHNNDILGMDLLVNPKKKTSSETMSVISSSSLGKSRKKSSEDESASEFSVPRSKSSRGKSKKEPVFPADDESASVVSESLTDASSHSMSSVSSEPRKRMSQEEIMNMKRELLYQFDRLERKGVKIPKKFTLASSLEEMKLEYERMKTDKEVESSIRFQRSMLQTFVSGVEFLNGKFNPLDVKLDGWSESINENIQDYDDIFEELYYKYRGKAKMPPELRLMFSVGGSAVMFHITNSMFKSSLPGIDQVMKQNPDLMKQFAAATMKTMDGNTAAASSGSGGGGFGIGGMLSSLFGFGGGGGGNETFGEPAPAPRAQMRGPSNMDDILRELHADAMPQPQKHTQQQYSDGIEVMSTITDSELSEIPEDMSSSGVFPAAKPKRGRSRANNNTRKVLNI